MPTSVDKQVPRSLVYGLQLLRLFSAEHAVRSISELAELMGVSPPTAHRYATTCLELGYLEQAPLRRYQLARRSAQLGIAMLDSLRLVRCSDPVLRMLRETSGRTASLAVLDGKDVVYLQRLRGLARGQYELEQGLGAGSRRAAEGTAAGRALLAAEREHHPPASAARQRRPTAGADNQEGPIEIHRLDGTSACALATAVRSEAERAAALELTLPAAALADAQSTVALTRELSAAARQLERALSGRTGASCRAEANVMEGRGGSGAERAGQEGETRERRRLADGRARYSQSLERGLAILASFTPQRPALGVRELAQELDMSRSTTHRYVSALASLGYLRHDAERKYRLALGVADLGLAAWSAMGLPTHAHPAMSKLARRTRRTVCLAVLDGTDSLIVHRVRRDGNATMEAQESEDPQTSGIGGRGPAYCTSAGKVLLAHLPAKPRAALIERSELVRRAPKTISDKRALQAQLEQVRDEGLAIADEELTPGVCAIAAPVRDDRGETLAAVTIAATVSMTSADELADRAGGLLIATAEMISRRLGWEER